MKNQIFFLALFFVGLQVNAQGIKNIRIYSGANGQSLTAYLHEMEEIYGLDFVYQQSELAPLTISGVKDGMYLSTYLNALLGQYKLGLQSVLPNVYFVVPLEQRAWEANRYAVLKPDPAGEQAIKGILTDVETGKPIIGAQVMLPGTGTGVLTDANGHFQLLVPLGLHKLEIRYLGYTTNNYVVGFSPYGTTKALDLTLSPSETELAGVTITADRENNNVQSLLPGVQRMEIQEIKKLPTFMGEVDPVKSLTTLPGVSTVGELASGFNVRGGEAGQNLIIQEGALIFNPTHLFGFFSAFNPDLVSDVALYKGGGPARFGGRAASVLDIKLRPGSLAQHSVRGGVGLMASRLSAEGPIVRNKASYIIGGRISYTNWLLRATNNIQLMNSSAKFYDLTAKLFYRINSQNSLSLTAYRSYDDFSIVNDSTLSWQTTNVSFSWDHQLSPALEAALTLSSSNYGSEMNSDDQIESFIHRNAVKSLLFGYALSHESEGSAAHHFGVEANKSLLEPGRLEPGHSGSNSVPVNIQDQHALETAAYWQTDVALTKRWAVAAGLRYSHFFRLGEESIYTFDYSNMQGRYPAISDTLPYEKGDLIEDYGGFEPRVSVRYLVSPNNSLKASYYRSMQYLHLITNTTTATPQDYWVASGPYLKPQIASQFSLGIFKNLSNDLWEFSLEGFYKDIRNAVDYIDGADISLNEKLEAGLVSGKGLAYGLEVLARRNSGSVYGWIAYTYSRTLRQYQSENMLLKINGGDFYPAPFDKPHDLSVVLNYQLAARITFSTNFSYSTGRPITIPISKYGYDDYSAILHYSERNEYRMPDYHRLDISLTIEGKQREHASFKGDWVFSIYNVYGRDNAYAIYFNKYGTARKLSILGSVFPSLSYSFSF